ncbi:MAG: hypothetical protein ABI743_06415 [bacterium]
MARWTFLLGLLVLLSVIPGLGCHGSGGLFPDPDPVYPELYKHVVSLGDGGYLKGDRGFAGTPAELDSKVWSNALAYWNRSPSSDGKKRMVVYIHGGLVSENDALKRIEEYRAPFMEAGVYPLAMVWHTGAWESFLDVWHHHVSSDRGLSVEPPETDCPDTDPDCHEGSDKTTEINARRLFGSQGWQQIKADALRASRPPATGQEAGGAYLFAHLLGEKLRTDPVFAGQFQLHLVGQSAGAIFIAHFLEDLIAEGVPVASCTLWAPACELPLYQSIYFPAVRDHKIEDLSIFGLSDPYDRADDCNPLPYEKSLLYLISNALEANASPNDPRVGVPLLGLENSVRDNTAISATFADPAVAGRLRWIAAPTAGGIDAPPVKYQSNSTQHHCFDDDPTTVNALLARILGLESYTSAFPGCLCNKPCDP